MITNWDKRVRNDYNNKNHKNNNSTDKKNNSIRDNKNLQVYKKNKNDNNNDY